ncbi:MAG: hypothetical protein DRP09_20700 [Candidatus Thorarchaeota archaeon]|nr:MAG: hypothetical protein DRP09_20700 [Candidatus Thorarchaeota archaeon]
MSKIKILFLGAYPDIKPLKLDEEVRAIRQKLRMSEHRDTFDWDSAWAVRPDDLLQMLNEHKPHIVHFSGHGSPSGEIILVDENVINGNRNPKPVSPEALRRLFQVVADNVRVVLLNACYSRIQAEAIKDFVDCVIGMNSEIGDQAAIIFASSFYRALGFGRSVKEAFEQGRVALMLEGIPEENTPELLCRSNVDPSRIFLIGAESEFLESPVKIVDATEVSDLPERRIKFGFPVIDFKFQNQSNIAVFLWRFELEVLHLEIDPTPVLEFTGHIVSAKHLGVGAWEGVRGPLMVSVINHGWGTAHNFQAELHERVLDSMFPKPTRQFSGDVESGEKRSIYILTKEMADIKKLHSILNDHNNSWCNETALRIAGVEEPKDLYQFRYSFGIVTWSCIDQTGKRLEGKDSVQFPSHWGTQEFYLTAKGEFVQVFSMLIGGTGKEAGFDSDILYCTLLDTSKEVQRRIYPVSRRIPPRDLDRFHVMVACEKSCYVKLKFRFFIDDFTIESDEYELHIWHPRNYTLLDGYKDGKVIRFDRVLGSHGGTYLTVIDEE